MASSMLSSASIATVNRATPVRASLVSPFTVKKSVATFPARKASRSLTSKSRNGCKVRCCMLVWPPRGLKKFETLSYLPDLTREELAKEIDYLLRMKWVPCLEFQLLDGFVSRENHRSPGYYDGRYWTMWKLPMFGCNDAVQVLKELDENIKAYPDAYIRIIGFDNVRQVQCISFIAYKPERFKST